MNYYTLEQVSKYNGQNGEGVWIIIKDVVYDVTNYFEKHPGGSEVISEYAGEDATRAFEDFGHTGDAVKELKLYKIGELVEEDRMANRKKKKTFVEMTKKESIKEERKRSFFRSMCFNCA